MEQHIEPDFAETKTSKLLEQLASSILIAVNIDKMHMGVFLLTVHSGSGILGT